MAVGMAPSPVVTFEDWYDKYAIVYRAAVVLNAVLAWSKRLSDMP